MSGFDEFGTDRGFYNVGIAKVIYSEYEVEFFISYGDDRVVGKYEGFRFFFWLIDFDKYVFYYEGIDNGVEDGLD